MRLRIGVDLRRPWLTAKSRKPKKHPYSLERDGMSEPVRRASVGLKALVARVNSQQQLVLNVGSDQGVKSGDIFRIISKEGIPINDPESGEPLWGIPGSRR